MKYMVMECHPGYAVVLGEDGQFLKAANLHYQVGQTVEDIVEFRAPADLAIVEKKKKRPVYRYLTGLAAAAACLVLLVTTLLQGAYASVYITINPEVRIDVDRRDTVVAVEGVNSDGRTLLEGYSFEKKDLDAVVDELVDRAIDMGFLHEGGKVTLTLDADERWAVKHEGHLSAQLQQHLTDRLTVTVDVAYGANAQIPVEGDTDYGESDYDDTDYGPNNDGVTDYDDTDYGPDNDGVTDYSDTDYDDGDEDDGPDEEGHTDYGPGMTDYGR